MFKEKLGTLGFIVGVLIGILAVMAGGGIGSRPSVQARPAADDPGGRYQIDSYGTQHGFGVYILDNTTGEVFLSEMNGRPRSIGSIRDPKREP